MELRRGRETLRFALIFKQCYGLLIKLLCSHFSNDIHSFVILLSILSEHRLSASSKCNVQISVSLNAFLLVLFCQHILQWPGTCNQYTGNHSFQRCYGGHPYKYLAKLRGRLTFCKNPFAAWLLGTLLQLMHIEHWMPVAWPFSKRKAACWNIPSVFAKSTVVQMTNCLESTSSEAWIFLNESYALVKGKYKVQILWEYTSGAFIVLQKEGTKDSNNSESTSLALNTFFVWLSPGLFSSILQNLQVW